MRAKAIFLIREYIVNDLRDPGIDWNSMVFKQRSHAKWAAKEVLKYVIKHKELTPIEAVSNFAKLMDYYSCKNPHTSYVFSVANDIAVDILDMLICRL